VQREIQQAAYEYQKAIESGKQVVVGVNRYTVEDATPIPILRVDPAIERLQVERLKALRARRHNSHAQAALKEVETTARSDNNLMPAILNAVKACVTVGEISDALRCVFGEYQESVVI
jgi:methylmalonyl-CoA mutase N-terminal domain/subunit